MKRVGKYDMGKTLGEGTFGKVKHAVHIETHNAVAIKILDKEKIQSQNMGEQIKREISIMKLVKHKHVIEMIEVLASKTKIFIVLELVTGGELFGKIVQSKKFSEDQAMFYFLQLVEGVEYCHKLGVCHRDLKPENLLLDEHGNMKISDFGLSSLYVGDAESDGAQRTQILHTTCGTPNYVAPEVLQNEGYDGKKADVWSIGVILYVMVAGFLPFDEPTIVQLFDKILHAQFTYPSWFSSNIRGILELMMVRDPKARVGLTQLRDHPWIKSLESSHASSSSSSSAAAATAVSSDSHTLHDNVSDEAVGDLDNDDWDSSTQTLKQLNGFDLLTQCGGFCLDRLFSPQLYATIKDGPIADSLSDQIGGNIRFGEGRTPLNAQSGTHRYNFSCVLPDGKELIRVAHSALLELGCECVQPVETAMVTGAIRANKMTSKGMIGIGVRAFNVSSQMSLLEVRRGKGSLFEWCELFNSLIDDKLKHVILRASTEEEAKVN